MNSCSLLFFKMKQLLGISSCSYIVFYSDRRMGSKVFSHTSLLFFFLIAVVCLNNYHTFSVHFDHVWVAWVKCSICADKMRITF